MMSDKERQRRARQRAESLAKCRQPYDVADTEAQKELEKERRRRARRRAMSVAQFCESYGVGRTKVYEELNAGRLRGCKSGRRTIITEDAAEDWLGNLPALTLDPRAVDGTAQISPPAHSPGDRSLPPPPQTRPGMTAEFDSACDAASTADTDDS
jgi:excisionase family DNA binding protein